MKKLALLTVVFLFTFSINAQKAIHEFDFNGTLSNTKNDVSFSGNAIFVNGRTGVPNNAIRLTSYIEATILNLPSANSSRTVSVWVKFNDISKTNYLWGYGSLYNARYFGLLQQNATDSRSDLKLAGCGDENDVVVPTLVASNTWYNYIVTYDGFTSKIYRNGDLIQSSISPRKLTSGIVFSIGKMGSSVSINADIDDLKLYDVAFSETEVMALFKTNSTLAKNVVIASTSKTGDTKKTSTSPTVEGKVKSAEIFSTKGVKVFVSNNSIIDMTTILEGTYLLQIQSSSDKKLTSNDLKIGESKKTSTVPSMGLGAKSSEIFSTTGAKVFAGNTTIIDISSIPVGAYSLKITSAAQSSIGTITSN